MKARSKNNFFVNLANSAGHVVNWVTSPNADIVCKTDQPGDVIYCVHGTADRANSFKVIAEGLLEQLGSTISEIHLVSFENRGKGIGIEGFSDQLRQKIKKNGHQEIILMGHSRGGLVCAHYKEYFSRLDGVKVKSVFTIGTPFGGSPLAVWPISKVSTSVQQMSVDSKFSLELCDKIRPNVSSYYFYAADWDPIVPLENAFLPEGSERLTILNGHEHLSMMRSQRLIDNIVLRLRERGDISLKTACDELSEYILELKQTKHLFSAGSKITLLETMLSKLNMMQAQGRGNEYPGANTIGEFIESFLDDKSMNINPVEILKMSLNMPFFYQTNTSSYSLVRGLIIRYKNVAITSSDIELIEINSNGAKL